MAIPVTQTTTFVLTATNSGGTTTATVTVAVAAPSPQNVFVSPNGNDTGNNCQIEGAPCKTIARAVSQVGSGGTVWLMDGAYTETCFACPDIVVPEGLTIRAKNPGGALLGSKLRMTGGRLAEIVIDRTIGFARVRLTEGTTTLQGIRWKGAFAGSALANVGLDISGDATATLVPGAASNYAAETTSENVAYIGLIAVRDTARLTVTGGVFDGPGVGFGSGAIVVTNSAVLTLDQVTVRAANRAIVAFNNATVNLIGSTLAARLMTTTGWGIRVNNNAENAVITLTGSQINGFVAAGSTTGAIAVATSGGNHSSASISLTNSTLSDNSLGVYVDGFSSASIQGSGLFIDHNELGGIRAVGNFTIDMQGGSISRNGFATTGTLFGGMTLGSGANHVKLRDVDVVDNKSPVVGAATAGNSGLTLAGNASSTFDLGTAADPGGNTITGNTTSAATTGIDVKVEASVTVTAVGNTFAPNVQGANASGHYVIGISPCGPTSCDVKTGAGVNYRVTTGKLRLAE
jgi:hypothetical protein